MMTTLFYCKQIHLLFNIKLNTEISYHVIQLLKRSKSLFATLYIHLAFLIITPGCFHEKRIVFINDTDRMAKTKFLEKKTLIKAEDTKNNAFVLLHLKEDSYIITYIPSCLNYFFSNVSKGMVEIFEIKFSKRL